MSTRPIAVVGSNMVDLVSYITRMPQEGETLEAPEFAVGCGGKGANQAVAAARSGATVMMVTRVGDDTFGADTVANLEKNGIDTEFALPTPGYSNGVAPIFVDPQGRNRILIIKGANTQLSPEDVTFARSRLHGCGLIVMQLEIPLDTVYATAELAQELGVPVLLNPAPAVADLDLSRLHGLEFLIPNESELGLLTGQPVATLDEIRTAATNLVQTGVRHVIVTLGSRGVLWLADGIDVLLEGECVEAVDTTGAGDAFIGAFSHEYNRTGDVHAAIAAGNRYAAVSVTRRGTQASYPFAGDLDETPDDE